MGEQQRARGPAADVPTLRTVEEMTGWSEEERGRGLRLGFVPTMGYFHEGHLSLIRLARRRTERVVVSIFVNPLQFGPQEDFDRYPRDMARDRRLAAQAGADVLFVPSVEEMYAPSYCTSVTVRRLSQVLCGAFRPGHFDGVATVVLKLLNVIRPHVLFLGEKDFQQAVILRRMITDLNVGAEVMLAPTVREPDGLAMSSRNVYLSRAERDAATLIYGALSAARELVREGETRAHAVVGEVRRIIGQTSLIEIEYVSAVDPNTLEETPALSGVTLIATAVRVGGCRLIDSLLCRPGGEEEESRAASEGKAHE